MGSDSRNNIIAVRPLKECDAGLIFKWRNLPLITQLSSSQRTVSWQEHTHWVKASVNNPNRLVFIIEQGTLPIGQIRFEKDDLEATEATVSIYILTEFAGKGTGKIALALSLTQVLEQWKQVDSIFAWVRKENRISQSFFQKQGFMPYSQINDPHHYVYIWQKQNANFRNIAFYTQLVDQYGIDVRSLNWGSKQSQELRFHILSQIGDLNGKSLLDVGCGLGDLYEWLAKNKITTYYKGIDITPKMIEKAKERFPQIDFEVVDFIREETNRFDFILMSGIFTYQNEEFLKIMIERAFCKANIGVAFNVLSDWAPQKDDNEFYADPLQILTFCKTLTPWIKLRHDYHSRDFTIYLYKKINDTIH
jgi:SAM-dependent methyltransferase